MKQNNLASKLEKKGNDLILELQKLKRYEKTGNTAIILFIVLGGLALFFPSLLPNEIQFEEEIRYIITTLTGISLIITIIEIVRARKINKKISGSDESFLYAYSAFSALDAYLDRIKYDSKLKHFEKALEELDNLTYSVSVGWRAFTRYNEILPHLDANMETFVNSIKGLKKALKNGILDPIEIQVTLIELMEFFDDDKKNKFKKINKELEKYNFVSKKSNIQHTIKVIINPKNLRHVMWVSILLAISIIPGGTLFLIDSELYAPAIVISGSLAVILIGAYVNPLLKKISTNE